MKTDNQYTFMDRRQLFEADYYERTDLTDPVKTITTIDINTIDLCNRSCVFCPRHDPSVYPNRNLRMTRMGAEIIGKRLQGIDFDGTIAISGFGENLLNPEIVDIISELRTYCPKAFIECNTNGDPLTAHLAADLMSAGLDCLNINMYDGPEQVEKFEKLLDTVVPLERRKFRAHWEGDHGIIYNNRSGIIKWYDSKEEADLLNTPCYYPFYKLFVDWNGDVLFCANDWGRTRIVGNLLQQTVRDVWMSKGMKKVRDRLSQSTRNFKPCNECNVKGTLLGKQSFDRLNEYENSSHRIK